MCSSVETATGGHLDPGTGEITVPGHIPGVNYNSGIPGITCMDVGTGAPGSKSDVQKKTIYGIVFTNYDGVPNLPLSEILSLS